MWTAEEKRYVIVDYNIGNIVENLTLDEAKAYLREAIANDDAIVEDLTLIAGELIPFDVSEDTTFKVIL